MEALHDVVKAGKARYIGASNAKAWQFAQMQHAAELHGWTKFVSMQDHYNLIAREEEREMLPFCQATGVGVIPWSPLARGRLTRPWGAGSSGTRDVSDAFGKTLYKQEEADKNIVAAVESVAGRRGVPMAQVALAWVIGKAAVSAPIVGATRIGHVDDAAAAAGLELSADEVAELEAAYTPREPAS
jgi:aryl-alcohol dehydrogenase (NADP+)